MPRVKAIRTSKYGRYRASSQRTSKKSGVTFTGLGKSRSIKSARRKFGKRLRSL